MKLVSPLPPSSVSPFALPLFSSASTSDSCHRQRTSPFLAPFYAISFLEMIWEPGWENLIPLHPFLPVCPPCCSTCSPFTRSTVLPERVYFSRISYTVRDCEAKKWLKWLFPSQTVLPDPVLWLGARLPKVTIHFSVHRDRYLLKPVLRFSPSPLLVLYFTVRSHETFVFPSKKKGEEG